MRCWYFNFVLESLTRRITVWSSTRMLQLNSGHSILWLAPSSMILADKYWVQQVEQKLWQHSRPVIIYKKIVLTKFHEYFQAFFLPALEGIKNRCHTRHLYSPWFWSHCWQFSYLEGQPLPLRTSCLGHLGSTAPSISPCPTWSDSRVFEQWWWGFGSQYWHREYNLPCDLLCVQWKELQTGSHLRDWRLPLMVLVPLHTLDPRSHRWLHRRIRDWCFRSNPNHWSRIRRQTFLKMERSK